MKTAYRFDDEKPKINTVVSAFRNIESIRRFVSIQGSIGSQKIWKINGQIISDDGSVDGLKIKVISVSRI